jgi:hypothetical protein
MCHFHLWLCMFGLTSRFLCNRGGGNGLSDFRLRGTEDSYVHNAMRAGGVISLIPSTWHYNKGSRMHGGGAVFFWSNKDRHTGPRQIA